MFGRVEAICLDDVRLVQEAATSPDHPSSRTGPCSPSTCGTVDVHVGSGPGLILLLCHGPAHWPTSVSYATPGTVPPAPARRLSVYAMRPTNPVVRTPNHMGTQQQTLLGVIPLPTTYQAAKRMPDLVVKPHEELGRAVLVQVLYCLPVEVRVKLVDHQPKLGDCLEPDKEKVEIQDGIGR